MFGRYSVICVLLLAGSAWGTVGGSIKVQSRTDDPR
jgi:hypothetical protein